ncbi:MAG: tetratricopeptide repeat protein [Sandaracinaceae bacterium]
MPSIMPIRRRAGLGEVPALALCLVMFGCGHTPPPVTPPGPGTGTGPPSQGEIVAFEAASAIFARHDAAGVWDAGACRETLAGFERVSEHREGQNARAVYMMGLVATRCGSDERAHDLYSRAHELDPALCEASVALANEQLASGDADAARRGFDAAIAADNLCASAYVNLAMLDAREPSRRPAAIANLRRALSVRADYLPALDQLALVYLASSDDEPQLLDLAEVVCRQAQLIDPAYAPIYNTWGLIDIAQGDITGAAAKLARATELDPTFYEAWMNFGQLTLSQRAYEDAARAFHQARALRGHSYDAAIGEGVALRGLTQPEAAERAYRAALELDGDRPEAYFDLAVLYHEHLDGTAEHLNEAEELLRRFVDRAGGRPHFSEEVEDVLRWCNDAPSRGRRGRVTCRQGRVQTIRNTLEVLAGRMPASPEPAWVREARAAHRIR